MVMKLYGAPKTGNCMRALLAVFEAGFEAEVGADKEVKLVLVDLVKKDQKKREYLDKNPLGRVPCLEDGNVIVFESRAIARFLAEKYQPQGGSFLGNTPEERATINQWCEVEGQDFMPAVRRIFREEYRFDTGTSTQQKLDEVVESCVPKVKKALEFYEEQLSNFDNITGDKYITGDMYTLADAFPTPYLYKLMNFKIEVFEKHKLFENYTRVFEWANRLISRPAFQKTLEKDKLWSKKSLSV